MSSPAERLAAARALRRVLVADDSDTYRAIACRVLADGGYAVEGAADGAEALDRLAGEPRPDLLVLELSLPKVRGLDLVRRIRDHEQGAAMPVLVVSDGITEHLRRVLADFGIEAQLTKNHALRELLYQVDALLVPLESERRSHKRSLSGLPVNYWVGERLYLQSCFDLSGSGMFVAVADEEPPPVGTQLPLRFWLPPLDRLIACDAEVVWRNTARGDLRTSHPPGMGLSFTRIAPDDRELVRRWLEVL